ncbi:MAG TPA: substrate-binding domain-containing protein, partial [bacterium]|nr:substrate-binding domain-containing protein [bacterium]
GHRKIGYVGRISGSLRYRLYLAAMKKNGVTPEKTWLCQVEKDDEDVPAESLLRAKQRPTAFFCDTDFKAANLMEKARVTELLVPEELSVIGFDDIPLAVRTKPALTTVYKPRYEMGREAGRMLACLLNGRDTAITRKRVLKTYLVHRESCAPPATLWQDYLPGRKKWEGKELLVQAVPVSR